MEGMERRNWKTIRRTTKLVKNGGLFLVKKGVSPEKALVTSGSVCRLPPTNGTGTLVHGFGPDPHVVNVVAGRPIQMTIRTGFSI